MVVIDFEVMHQVLGHLYREKIIQKSKTVEISRNFIRTEHELFDVIDEEPEGGSDFTTVLLKTQERVYIVRYLLMRSSKEDLTKLN